VPSLPVSFNPAASGEPAAFVSGPAAAASPPELELELLLDELELLPAPLAPAPLPTGLSFAAPVPSPGNGNCAAVFAAEPAPAAAPAAAPVAAPELALAASGACGTPLRFAGAAYGVSEAPLPLASSGNGNCWVAFTFPGSAVVVPHGTGCGATEHGAGPAAAASNGAVPAVVPAVAEGVVPAVAAEPCSGLDAGVLCAPQAIAAHAIHAPATTTIPKCLRISFPFPSSLDDSAPPKRLRCDRLCKMLAAHLL
jgi:hypothetical protein